MTNTSKDYTLLESLTYIFHSCFILETILDLQGSQVELQSKAETANQERDTANHNLKYMTSLYEKANDTISR